MIISLISFLGLVFGYYLTSIFKQELKDVEKFIAITMNIVIILLIISLVLVSNLSLIFIIAIIFGILTSLIIKNIYFYFGFILVFSSIINLDARFNIAILIFIYGLLFSSVNFKKINLKFILTNLILFLLPFILLLFKEFTLQNLSFMNIIFGFSIGGLVNGVRLCFKKAKK